MAGNIYGDRKTFSAGKQNAAGVDVSADTIFRMASMTKIIGVCGPSLQFYVLCKSLLHLIASVRPVRVERAVVH